MRENVKINREDYTVLLMLKDRFPFTKRWLNYMAAIKFPYKIFIADGSADDQAKRYLEANKEKFSHLDINYVRYPHDENYSVYYKKIADALGKIKTKYVSVSDNDDFYVVDGIARSIDFLEKNADYSSCRGEISSIAIYTPSNRPDLKFLYGKSGSIVYKYYYGESIEFDRSSERVLSHGAKYDPTFYDVHRTGHLKMCFEILRDINPENLYVAEFLTSFLTVASGKIKRLPCLYYVRQTNAPGSSNAAEAKRYDFFERMLLPSWSHDYCGMEQAVAKIISGKDGISFEDASLVFMKAYKKSVARNIIWSVSRKELKQPTILDRIVGRIQSTKRRLFRGPLWRRIEGICGKNRRHFLSLKSIIAFLSGEIR